MIFRPLSSITGTDRDVDWGHGRSRRLLVAGDGVGFAVADTLAEAGTSSPLHYRNHVVACYCLEGEGFVEVDGARHAIGPGSFYVMNDHDETVLHATTALRIVSIFNPPIEGHERHAFDGESHSSY